LQPSVQLEHLLPDPDVRTRHEIAVRLPPERALALALGLPAGCDPIARLLLVARGLRADLPIEHFLKRLGLEVLERTPLSFVAGASGRPWLPRPELESFDDARPGMVRFGTDLRAVEVEGGCVLSTETRVFAADETARLLFACYWTVVGPLSGLLRKRWLTAAAAAATRA
jgi:hypothetical protein